MERAVAMSFSRERAQLLGGLVYGLTLSLGCSAPAADEGPNGKPDAEAATSSNAHGFDVSHHQGEIDWTQLAAGDFVFIKASEGVDYEDPLFAVNWRGARDRGLLRGAYHMFRPEDEVAPQVRFFVALLERVGYGAGDLPPALDVESNSGVAEVSRQLLRDRSLAWLDQVERRLGRRPVLYTNPSFWRGYLEPEHPLTSYPLWLAAYSDADPPELVEGWRWTFWQYTEGGTLPGIAKPVDLNRFAGSREQLRAFAGGQRQP